MQYPNLFAAALAMLVVASCVSPAPTPYQAADPVFGYAEERRDDGSVVVRFAGNPDTDRETVEHYALYRAAEVALAGGHNGFEVLDRTVEIRMREIRDPFAQPAPPAPIVTRRGETVYVAPRPMDEPRAGAMTTDILYNAVLVIRPFTAESIVETPLRYDAREVRLRLAPKIKRPGAAAR